MRLMEKGVELRKEKVVAVIGRWGGHRELLQFKEN